MSSEEQFDMYPNDEEFYEMYEMALERGEAEPPETDITRRIRASYQVSAYDDRRSTTPFFQLAGTGRRQPSTLRTRVTGY